ncbi:FHA domain-containing protein [Salinibacterium sp. M195]|uniref:FHA domain-containing protein n=1 Tax=Salinibacterium sp. M195 TaxID=2583374 RepID=UPI001C630A64|nr:FHA domain-containing protein [Salinibacterium sp. M195]QYH36540.1 FHA domain-containing protein [Salinibacterium sp. M195]
MKLDLDDTMTAGDRPIVQSNEPDLDDTIILAARQRPRAVKPYEGPVAPRAKSVGQPAAARMPSQVTAQPATTSRPAAVNTAEALALFYRVQLDGASQAHNLEHPCVFGRDPRPPRIVRGTGPRLIAVTSPTREVSETHVEIRQLGSSVIVTDLRSTNGSVVQVPGNAARKLRQGESVVVSAGTLVDIGDGNIIRILPRQRLA